jgi:hypothetical protein
MDAGLFGTLIVDGLSTLTTFIVLVAALVAAVMLTRRKQCLAGGWLLVVGRLGIFCAAFGFLVVNVMVMRMLGFEVAQWLYILLKLLMLGSACLVAVAMVLFNPKKIPPPAGTEVTHG